MKTQTGWKVFFSKNGVSLSQFKVCPQSQCVSTPGHRTDLFLRHPGSVLITDFFGSVRKVEITREVLNLTAPAEEASAVT